MTSLYIVAWIASLMYGLEAIIGKLISKHSVANPWLFNFMWELFVLIGTVIVGFYFGIGVPTHWAYIIGGSLMYAIAGILYILVLYKVDVSVIGPLFSFRTVMAVLVGTFFLGEILTIHQYILIGVILIAGIFVTFDENFKIRSFFNRWISILLAQMLCLVILALCIKKSTTVNNFWDTTVWIAILGQIWILPTIPLFKKDVAQTTKRQYASIALIAFAGVIGTLAANAAYSKNISIAAAIISLPLSMIAAFLFSKFAPGLLEKHTNRVYIVRFVFAAIMIVAALKL